MIGFFLSGSMLFYTVVSELSADNTRGVALSLLNTIVFLFNTAMLFIPYLFITAASTEFFTYLWILPFCVMFSILLVYYIKETYTKGSSI
jgi:MFS family permease